MARDDFPVRLRLRLDDVTEEEIVQTLLFNDEPVGVLKMRQGEYQLFGACLGLGSDHMSEHLKVIVDPISFTREGEFCMPGKEFDEDRTSGRSQRTGRRRGL